MLKHSQEMWEPFLPTPGSLHYFAQVAAVWGWPLSPQARRTQRDPVSATNSGAGRSGGVDPAGVEGRPSRRPAPDAGWGGLLAAPSRRDSTAEPQGCGGCLRATRRSQFGRREPALSAPWAGRIPTRSPRARAGRGPGCGPESLEPASWPWARWLAKGSASRLHLQPQWPRHDPLLLCQRGHLAKRHQPAVSAPRALLPSANARKVCVLAVALPSILGSKRTRAKLHPAFLAVLGRPGRIVGWRWG